MKKSLGKRIHDTRETVEVYALCTTCTCECSICDCDCSAHGAPNYAVAYSFGITNGNAVSLFNSNSSNSIWN